MKCIDKKCGMVSRPGRGLGGATGKLLYESGEGVVVTDRDVEAGNAMARSIDPTGARACFIAHDVTDEKQWTSVIQQTVERFGSLSILVNNAGVGAIGTVEDDTYERWKWFQ